jgi:hypothetical protein
MYKILGSNTFLRNGNRKLPQASYNERTLGIYVIVKKDKKTYFYLQIYIFIINTNTILFPHFYTIQVFSHGVFYSLVHHTMFQNQWHLCFMAYKCI